MAVNTYCVICEELLEDDETDICQKCNKAIDKLVEKKIFGRMDSNSKKIG